MILGISLITLLVLQGIVCPPVKVGTKKKEQANDSLGDTGLAYDRYLKEVVAVLETDPVFKQQLERHDTDYIKSGEIAKHLDLVHHKIRLQLDEIKRREVNRLKEVVQQQMKLKKGKEIQDKVSLHHLDILNPQSFGINDLAKLIKQATKDLDELDQKRKLEFKEYEMRKAIEMAEKLKQLNETQRKIEEKNVSDMEVKHKNHPKLHEPGSKAQLEEVWEEGDHLNPDDFNPKTFFKLHDINGDGVLDLQEVEALFTKEIEKMYDPNSPEDDMNEAQEEIARMREHLFNTTDKDHNKVIDLNEFVSLTKSSDFEKDDGWKTIDDDEQYSQEDLREYQKMLDEEKEQLRQHEILGGHAQPGEINIPVQNPNVMHMQQNQGYQNDHLQKAPHHQEQVLQHQQVPQHQEQFLQHQQVPQHQEQVPQHQQVPRHQEQVPQHQQVPRHQEQVPQHQQVPRHQEQVPQHQQVPQQQQVPQHQQVPQLKEKVPQH